MRSGYQLHRQHSHQSVLHLKKNNTSYLFRSRGTSNLKLARLLHKVLVNFAERLLEEVGGGGLQGLRCKCEIVLYENYAYGSGLSVWSVWGKWIAPPSPTQPPRVICAMNIKEETREVTQGKTERQKLISANGGLEKAYDSETQLLARRRLDVAAIFTGRRSKIERCRVSHRTRNGSVSVRYRSACCVGSSSNAPAARVSQSASVEKTSRRVCS